MVDQSKLSVVGESTKKPHTQDLFDEQFGLIPPDSADNCSILCENPLKTFRKQIISFIPILNWLPNYDFRANLLGDIFGGFTIGVMSVSQSLAYASIVGLQPIEGLYTAFFTALFYMFFTTSKLSSTGVSAVICLMVGRSISQTVTLFNPNYSSGSDQNETLKLLNVNSQVVQPINAAMSLTLCVGLIQVMLAVLRLDFVMTYMSDQVINGFTTGAATHVLVSQIDKMLGVKLSRHSGFLRLFKTVYDLATEVPNTNIATAIISLITITSLLICKNKVSIYAKKYCKMPLPFDLIVIILGIIVSYSFNLDTKYRVKVLGNIPRGLSPPSLPKIWLLPYVFADALAISIIVLAMACSMGKLFANKYRYAFDVKQEFYAIGLTGCLTSFLPCWTPSIALSRSLVNESAGTKTQLSVVFSSLVLISVIYLFGAFMHFLPTCILACIVVVALKEMLMKVYKLPSLWHYSKYDFTIQAAQVPSKIAFIIVDFAAVSQIDAMGVDALVEVYKGMQQRNIRLMIANARSSVIQTVGRSTVLKLPPEVFYPSVEDARRATEIIDEFAQS